MSDMLAEGRCVPRMHGAVEQHTMDVPAEGGGPERAVLIQQDEKLCILVDGTGGDLSDFELATEPVSLGEGTGRLISVEFKQLDIGAVVVARHQYDKPLRYRALMKVPGQEPAPTSICPVRPGMAGIEHWPHAIEMLMLGDFHLVEAGAPLDCR